MKQKETLLTTPLSEQKIELSHLIIEEMGDEHKASSVDTPMRADAFDKTDEEKIALIEPHFRAIMETIGMDLSDDSLRGTPLRVAKMYVKELFQGLNPANMPSMTLFEINFSTMKCWSKKISISTPIVSTILYHFLVKRM